MTLERSMYLLILVNLRTSCHILSFSDLMREYLIKKKVDVTVSVTFFMLIISEHEKE